MALTYTWISKSHSFSTLWPSLFDTTLTARSIKEPTASQYFVSCVIRNAQRRNCSTQFGLTFSSFRKLFFTAFLQYVCLQSQSHLCYITRPSKNLIKNWLVIISLKLWGFGMCAKKMLIYTSRLQKIFLLYDPCVVHALHTNPCTSLQTAPRRPFSIV